MLYRFHKSLTSLFGSLLLLLSLGTQAQNEKWYRVEMLIFSNSGGSTSEDWEGTPILTYPARSRSLIDPDHQPATAPQGVGDTLAANAEINNSPRPTPFVTQPGKQLEFRRAVAQMQRSGRYRKLFHKAWTQPIGRKSEAIPIVLDRSGDTEQWPALQGTIKLYVSRYLYLETNLWLNTRGEYLESAWSMPPPPLGPTTPGFVSQEAQSEYPYRHAVLLQQTRRMRSKEVNYIDHPMFGVVVKVTPLAAPETES